MATEIMMPKMGFDMTEGTVASWLKQVGEAVKKGEPVVEIETDKTTIQVEAETAGVLVAITVPAGEKVPVNTPIGMIGAAGESIAAKAPAPAPAVSAAPAVVAAPPAPAAVAASAPAPVAASAAAANAAPVTMPKMGFDMTEGTVASWLKQVGDAVKKGEPVVEIETDKTTIQVEAESSGKLLQIVVAAGERVPVNTVIGYIGDGNVLAGNVLAGNVLAAPQPVAPATPAVAAPAIAPQAPIDNSGANATPIARRMADELKLDLTKIKGTGPEGRVTKGDIEAAVAAGTASASVASGATSAAAANGRVIASPYAKKLAAELSVDLARTQGSGPEGRIVSDDVKKAAAAGILVSAQPSAAPAPTVAVAQPVAVSAPVVAQPAAPAPKAATPPPAGTRREPLSKMRQTIASRLAQSKGTVPHYYVATSVEMDAALAMRVQINEALKAEGVKVSVNDLVLRATALTIKKFPKFNATFAGDAIDYRENINLGVAVAMEGGLIVINVRDVDKKTLKQIGAEVPAIAARVREGKGQPGDMGGQTFTTSNLGMYGVEDVIPIINQPDSGILGIGNAIQTPVVKDGQIVVRSMMKLWLAADHRVTDGAEGAQFVAELKRLLENPWALVL
ncbi:MAG: 2-oxo acid dehydrogenase subunit E2 [Anaerolineae bacterium]|nr:2-oxo acid dehydrogenase subunit E2 [Anaerolineae bacterium]